MLLHLLATSYGWNDQDKAQRPICFEAATQREIWRILINQLSQTAECRTSEKLAQTSTCPWLLAVHCWTSLGVEASQELGLLERQSSLTTCSSNDIGATYNLMWYIYRQATLIVYWESVIDLILWSTMWIFIIPWNWFPHLHMVEEESVAEAGKVSQVIHVLWESHNLNQDLWLNL